MEEMRQSNGGDEAVTPAQIGREMARERSAELRRVAEHHRLARVAAGAEGQGRTTMRHSSRWLVRIVGAAIRL